MCCLQRITLALESLVDLEEVLVRSIQQFHSGRRIHLNCSTALRSIHKYYSILSSKSSMRASYRSAYRAYTVLRIAMHSDIVPHLKAERGARGGAEFGRGDADRSTTQDQCGRATCRRALRRRRSARAERGGLLAVLCAKGSKRARREPGLGTQSTRWRRGTKLRTLRAPRRCRWRYRYSSNIGMSTSLMHVNAVQ